MHWYYAENGTQQGPVEFEKLVALVAEGRLKPDDLVWNSSMGKQWAKASTVAGLFEQAPPAPASGGQSDAEWSAEASFKSAASNKDLMAQARAALDGNWGISILGLLIYWVAAALFSLLWIIIGGPMMVGWNVFYLTIARREPADIGRLFDGFKNFANAFVASLLIMLLMIAWCLPAFVVGIVSAVYAGVAVFQGSMPSSGITMALSVLTLVAIIPAVIAQFRYSLTFYILVDYPGVGPMEAIRRSKQMMVGNKWKLFCLQLRFIGWAFLCMLTLGIGFLWLVPYMMVSQACFYDDVKKGV